MNFAKPTQACILVIDSDPRFVRLMRNGLESAGYRAVAALDVASAFSLMEAEDPQLILLDITMPGADSYDALRKIRSSSTAPVILVGSNDVESEKVKGLNLGADDFICKPIGLNELLARVRALLRRVGWPKDIAPQAMFVCGDIEINFATRRVLARGREISLSRTEYKLLAELVGNAGRVMLHEDLLSRVWGPDYRHEIDYLRVYVRHLRIKLEQDASKPLYIVSKQGIGYMFARPTTDESVLQV